jgi:hypothetical protein
VPKGSPHSVDTGNFVAFVDDRVLVNLRQIVASALLSVVLAGCGNPAVADTSNDQPEATTASSTATTSTTATPTATPTPTIPVPPVTARVPTRLPLPAPRTSRATAPTESRTKVTTRPKATTTKPTSTKATSGGYANCSEARAAGAAPILRGEPGYAPKLDRDSDGIACE